MKTALWLTSVSLLIALSVAATSWNRASQLRLENQTLRLENEALKQQVIATADIKSREENAEVARLKAGTEELLRLRSEVTQLHSGAKETERLRAENSQLRTQNQQLQAGTLANANANTASGTTAT